MRDIDMINDPEHCCFCVNGELEPYHADALLQGDKTSTTCWRGNAHSVDGSPCSHYLPTRSSLIDYILYRLKKFS